MTALNSGRAQDSETVNAIPEQVFICETVSERETREILSNEEETKVDGYRITSHNHHIHLQ